MPEDRDRDTTDDLHVDPLDREAAQIDARSENAPEEIEELIEHARSLERDAPSDGATPN